MSTSSPESSMVAPTLQNTMTQTPEIRFGGARGGVILIPAGSPINQLIYYAAEKYGGTYLPLKKNDGVTVVTQTVTAGAAIDMPLEVYGVIALKIAANVAGPVFVTMKG